MISIRHEREQAAIDCCSARPGPWCRFFGRSLGHAIGEGGPLAISSSMKDTGWMMSNPPGAIQPPIHPDDRAMASTRAAPSEAGQPRGGDERRGQRPAPPGSGTIVGDAAVRERETARRRSPTLRTAEERARRDHQAQVAGPPRAGTPRGDQQTPAYLMATPSRPSRCGGLHSVTSIPNRPMPEVVDTARQHVSAMPHAAR